MPGYTIAYSNQVVKILKLAYRSARQAMFSDNGDDHIDDVRTAFAALTGTNADVVAKAIIDIVKNDNSE
jgi:hypothetical protein